MGIVDAFLALVTYAVIGFAAFSIGAGLLSLIGLLFFRSNCSEHSHARQARRGVRLRCEHCGDLLQTVSR